MYSLLPYSNKSKGAKLLATSLGALRVTPNNTPKYQETVDQRHAVGKTTYLINWGCGSISHEIRRPGVKILNNVKSVNLCRDKLRFFNLQKNSGTPARVPVFTDSLEEALEWVEEGIVTMGRALKGSCGNDIAFFDESVQGFHASDFWVQYKKKKQEYRIHYFNGDVILAQRKALRDTDSNGNPIDTSTVNFRIRNHKNGFIFQRYDVTVPDDVLKQSKIAFDNTGLIFGAVDVIYNQHEDQAYVLEINTAPGLEGSTVTDYATAFNKFLEAA